MAILSTRKTAILAWVATLTTTLPLVLAHGHAPHGDNMTSTTNMTLSGGGAITETTMDPNLDAFPPTYFSHPDHRTTLWLHIILMSLAWIFILPTAVMLSLSRSRYTLRAQVVFLVMNSVGLAIGSVYNARTPDLYLGNVHHWIGWVVSALVVVHVFAGLVGKMVAGVSEGSWGRSRSRGGNGGDGEVLYSVIDGAGGMEGLEGLDEGERRNKSEGDGYRVSNDSGQGTEPVSEGEGGRRSVEMVVEEAEEGQQEGSIPPDRYIPEKNRDSDSEEDQDEDENDNLVFAFEELTLPTSPHFPQPNTIATPTTRNTYSERTSTKAWKIASSLHTTFDQTLPAIGFVVLSTGTATLGRFFEGHAIFSGLAHSITGGVVFWWGIFTLARWSGVWGELGWAWNSQSTSTSGPFLPLGEGKTTSRRRGVTAEFVESAAIFTYGATNIFLEHLGNWGGKWDHEDMEHISMTALFIGGGLCGMLVESPGIRGLLDPLPRTLPRTTAISDPQPSHSHHGNNSYGNHDNDNDEEAAPATHHHHHSPNQHNCLNPLPPLTILLTSLILSTHTQSTATGTSIHTQVSNLLLCFSLSRFLTLVLLYLRPVHSNYPSRPPSELVAAFSLMAGGLILMASAGDIVTRIEAQEEVDVMVISTVLMGGVGMIMAWVLCLRAVGVWAGRREMMGVGRREAGV